MRYFLLCSGRIIGVMFLVFLFYSCSSMYYAKSSTTVKIVFKSEKFRINETAFLNYDNDSLFLKINSSNAKEFKIFIKDDICINNNCLSKKNFNKDFFHNSYPNDLLENILKSNHIFGSKNIQRTKNGFFQKIGNIFYEVNLKKTIFRDSSNRILIKIQNI